MKTLALLLALASFAVGSETCNSTVVLVRGAFAGGSSCAKLIPILERDGDTAIAPLNGRFVRRSSHVDPMLHVRHFAEAAAGIESVVHLFSKR